MSNIRERIKNGWDSLDRWNDGHSLDVALLFVSAVGFLITAEKLLADLVVSNPSLAEHAIAKLESVAFLAPAVIHNLTGYIDSFNTSIASSPFDTFDYARQWCATGTTSFVSLVGATLSHFSKPNTRSPRK